MSEPLSELKVLITAQSEQFEARLASIQTQLKSFGKTMQPIGAKAIAFGNILSTAVTGALRSVSGVIGGANQAFKDTSASLTKLATVMGQRGATQAQYDSVVALTAAEERLGVVSATAMQNGLQELATYVGKAESLERLTKTMNNLIVQQYGYEASSLNALQTATMMGKVLQGQTGGMERIGYHLDDAEKKLFEFGTEEERVALLTQIVGDNLGDMNRRLGETNVGKQVQLANVWAQLRAQIGELATAVGTALLPVFRAVATAVAYASAWVKAFLGLFGVKSGVSSGMSSIATSASQASSAMTDYGSSIAKAGKKAKGALAGFDEMNVLMEKTSEAGDGGGGGGGADILADLVPSEVPIEVKPLLPDVSKMTKDLQESLRWVFEGLSGLDFGKIKASFGRLWEDLKVSGGNVFAVISDVWKRYLGPFLTWAGNNLLPAFLNALGGALQFLSAVGRAAYETFIRPFVDFFLVPIAKFTGGVIVSVLNGIGNALRGLAQNKWITTFAAALLIFKSLGLAITATAVAFLTMGSNADKTKEAVKAFNDDFAKIDASLAEKEKSLRGVTGSFGDLGEAMSEVRRKTEVARAGSVQLIEAFGLSKESSQKLKDATENYSKSLERTVDLKKEITDLERESADVQLAVMDAEDRLAEKQEALNEAVSKYGANSREAKKAQLEVESASNRLAIAKEKEKVSSDNLASATAQLTEALDDEIIAEGKMQIEAAKSSKSYEEINKTIRKLSEDGSENSRRLRDQIIQHARENGMEWDASMNGMREKANIFQEIGAVLGGFFNDACVAIQNAFIGIGSWFADRFNDICNAFSGAFNAFVGIGQAIWDGICRGIGDIASKVGDIFGGLVDAVKNLFGIRSPSRVFAKIGGFLSEGLALGITNKHDKVQEALADLTEGFSASQLMKFDVSASASGVTSSSLAEAARRAEALTQGAAQASAHQPIQLLLKIDGENIPISAERITDALSHHNLLNNRNMLTI